MMTVKLTKPMVEQVEKLLTHGSRVEVLIEQGQVAIVEVKRKLRMKEYAEGNGPSKSNGAMSN